MEPGNSLGPYRIDRELGAGGMGKVYAATVEGRCPGIDEGTRVALKVVHSHLLETTGFFRRFMREAELGASIRHENVVRTLHCDQLVVDGTPHAFLVMEYVEGKTLAELLTELDSVPEELCRHIAREICKGLAAIHEAGVLHRDLKPENVLITQGHVVKVMDLGVARLAEESIRLSRSGGFVGSVEYAAPEQFGGDVDHRCDLHALGVLLYELSSAQHPFRGDDFRGVMRKVCDEEPRKLGEVNPQLSVFFEEVVHTLLQKRRDDRFASADELLGVLEEGQTSPWWRERAKAIRAETNRPLRRIRIPRETAVYGRDPELAQLRGLFDLAHQGDGQVVLVEGEAGIGKSRLVDELIGRLRADGEELNFVFGSYPPGGAVTAAGGFSHAYREHFGELGSAEYLPQTPLLVPAFDAVLRGEPAPSDVVELTKDSLGTCFVHVTRNLAAERTTVVLLDDLHFAPPEALALFTALGLAVSGHRVLLIGTARPGLPETWRVNLTRAVGTTRVHVDRLGPKDLAALLRDSFRSERLAEQLAYQIGTKSDGNPFFAFEIIRGLREGQFITRNDDGTWVSTQVIEDIQIPSSVLDLVNARVADLSDEDRNLLDVAACWGYEFDASLVGEALGLSRLPVLQSIAKIEKRDRLIRSSGRHFVFDHHQVQEALYGALPEMLREEYHGALAEALESRTSAADRDAETLDGALCVDLAEHFLDGARGARGLRYLDPALLHLSRGYLHAQAAALGERALAVSDLLVGTERVRILLRLVHSLDRLGRRTRQEDVAREAEDLAAKAGDDELRGRAALALGWCLFLTSRAVEAERLYRQSLELVVACGDRRAEADGLLNVASSLRSQGRLAEGQEQVLRSLQLSREIAYRSGEAAALVAWGTHGMAENRWSDAQVRLEQGLALSREIGNRRIEAVATMNLGGLMIGLGCFPEARSWVERGLEMEREVGGRLGEAGATVNLGYVHMVEGRVVEAREWFERGLALTREVQHRGFEANALFNLAGLSLDQGRLGDARALLEEHLETCREIGDLSGQIRTRYSLALVSIEEGDAAAGESALEAVVAASDEPGMRVDRARALLAIGALRIAAGDGETGRQALEAALALARQHEWHQVETSARCVLAALPGGDAQDAVAAYSEHADHLEPSQRREAALLLWTATGDRAHIEEAKRLLDEALSNVPTEFHESMLTNLRVNREIMAACNEHGL